MLSPASSLSPFSSSSTWSSRLLLCSLWWFWMTAKKQITQDRLDRCDLNSVAGDLSGLNLNSRWFIGLWHEGHAWKGAATATGEIQQWLWVFNIFVSLIYLLSFVFCLFFFFFCPFVFFFCPCPLSIYLQGINLQLRLCWPPLCWLLSSQTLWELESISTRLTWWG